MKVNSGGFPTHCLLIFSKKYNNKQRVPCYWQGFIHPGVGLCDRVCYGNTYIKIGTIQRRLAWPLRKDDTQIREAFQIFNNLKWPGHTFAILPGGTASRRSLIGGSSYIEPGPAAGISSSSLVSARWRKWPVVQCHDKQRLPCYWQGFIYPGVGLWDRVCYRNTYIKIGRIHRRLACRLRKDYTQICEAFQIFNNLNWPGHTFAILPGGRASRRSLIAGSSYIEPEPAAGILRCSLVAGRRSKWAVVQCHHEQSLPCWWQGFIDPSAGLCDRVSYGNTYIKLGTIQKRLACPLRKNDRQIREAFRIFNNLKWPAHTFAILPKFSGSRSCLIAGSS